MKTHLHAPRGSVLGWLAAAAVALTAGCNLIPPPLPDPTHYYVLTGPALTDTGGARPGGQLRLGLKTVDLSPYLRKGTLVVRRGTNELFYNEDARWAEPLEAGIARALRAHLSTVPAVAHVYPQPYPGDQERDYDVAVNVVRCEGALDAAGHAAVKFSAVLEINRVKSPGLIVTRKVFTAPDAAWDGKDYGALAQALSEAVGALGQEIAAVLPDKE
jgi:uncharacterized lipoprotein YmbA